MPLAVGRFDEYHVGKGEGTMSRKLRATCFAGLFLLPTASVSSGSTLEGAAVLPLRPLPNWRAHIDEIDASFGWSVARAGDVNGDGFDDVIVGTPSYDFDSGKVFAYYGSASGLSITPDWTAETNVFEDELGLSVGMAGTKGATTTFRVVSAE